jgi:hypothetical protein
MILSRHDSVASSFPSFPSVPNPFGLRLAALGNASSFFRPYSGCPRATRFQASFDSLKFRSNATFKPVVLSYPTRAAREPRSVTAGRLFHFSLNFRLPWSNT